MRTRLRSSGNTVITFVAGSTEFALSFITSAPSVSVAYVRPSARRGTSACIKRVCIARCISVVELQLAAPAYCIGPLYGATEYLWLGKFLCASRANRLDRKG